MWMRAQGTQFTQGTPPQWVDDWLGRRRGPAAAKPATTPAEGVSIAALIADPDDTAAEDDQKAAAQAEAQRDRTRLQREAMIAEGLDALDRWLLDELARGLAGFDQRAEAACGLMARRLVDAKAGGLANRLAGLPSLLLGLDEAARGLAAAQELASIHLIASAYRRQNALSPALRADVRQVVGWTIGRDALLTDSRHFEGPRALDRVGDRQHGAARPAAAD